MKYTEEVSGYVEHCISILRNKYAHQRFFGADMDDLCQLVRISVWRSLKKVKKGKRWKAYVYCAVRQSLKGYCISLTGSKGTMRKHMTIASSIDYIFHSDRYSDSERDEAGNYIEPRDIIGGENLGRFDLREFIKSLESSIPEKYLNTLFEDELTTKEKLKSRHYFRKEYCRKLIREAVLKKIADDPFYYKKMPCIKLPRYRDFKLPE